ncbi:kinase-like domain-containing protein [Mycena latifolia]|nr:kinase-like domain-containing protein [Mycena latifolia]
MSLGERCDACGSTTALSTSSHTVPRIEIETLDLVPFSESFSGLFEDNNDGDEYDSEDDQSNEEDSVDNEDERQTNKNEMSYNVEQFSDMKYIDPEWDDDDVEEVMVLSPKQQRYSKLPTISEERDAFSIASNEAHCSQTFPQADPTVTLADFDIIPSSGFPMLCRRRSTNKVYVIKALEPCLGSEPHFEGVVMEAIRALRAPFLERLYWSFPGIADGEEGRIYLVLESHSGGSLIALMDSRPITPTDVLFYVCEVVEALSSLHVANIIHRDLTPSNISLDHTGHVVLSNFSNAILLSASTQYSMPPSAAMEYQAPEILLGWAHDFAVDCWSFGVLLHFLLAGTNPVVKDDDAVRNQILTGNAALSEVLPLAAKDLIIRCLERNAVLRLSIGSIKEHDYFATVDWYRVRQKNIPPPARSPSPPKLRPTSQDFPLPPTTRLSQNLDTSLDVSFTFHTASKAVPSQPRLERVYGRERVTDKPFRSYSSMDDLRGRWQRLSLNVPSRSAGTSLSHARRSSMQDAGTSSSCLADITPADPFQPFSPRLSLLIQTPDSLPKIFRPTVLDDRLVEEEPSHPSPAISSPTVCELSPRERMAQFWETLDAEEGSDSGSSVPSLELRDALKLALPCPPLPISRPRRLRKRASTVAFPPSQSDHRFSIVSATHATTTKLRKLRRPLSTPLMAKRSEPILNLPPGVEQIGRGIGFTYKIPVASHSKASICVTTTPSAAGRLLRDGLGFGKGLLRRAKSQPKFAPAGVAGRRAHGPPARIQTSPGFVAPGLNSPVSDGPLTPDSLTFPPLPEIVGDPFAKDEVGDEVRSGVPDATLRLVPASADHRLPFSPTMQPLDKFMFSTWST